MNQIWKIRSPIWKPKLTTSNVANEVLAEVASASNYLLKEQKVAEWFIRASGGHNPKIVQSIIRVHLHPRRVH